MRIVRFQALGIHRVGLVHDDEISDLSERFATVAAVLEAWMEDPGQLTGVAGRRYSPDDVQLLPPVDRAARVFAIAQNYPAHAAEYGGPRPPAPVMFLKPSSSLSGASQDVELPALSSFFDYEGELAAVIGRRGRNVSPDQALEYIAGYTICNDGSARDLQDTTLGGKPIIDWFSAKNLEGASPVGPWIVTRDEVPDPQNLHIQTRLNGVTVQDDRTGSMVFSLAEQVAFVSQRLMLEPGDLISTGTPAGVGKARGRPLQAGDDLEIEIERIGILRNRFVGSSGRP
jgi:2-keto-4-pentenoate hydratase/2-oxohepta-3-ene-1,7-dioic acid hydratase in catechol pathway